MSKRILLKIVNSMNKIGLKLYVYIILLILLLVYPSNIGRTNPCNDANTSEYVPKNKRNDKTKVITSRLTKWANKIIDNIMGRLESTYAKRKISKRRLIARRFSNQYHNTTGIKAKIRVIAFPIMALMANQKSTYTIAQQRNAKFDTDSKSIGVDNRCSACISNDIDDFIGNVTDSKRTIKGFGGTNINNIMTGTILWKWEDSDGRVHHFKIPNSYYVPRGEVKLLSPQHWAQTQIKQGKSSPGGIGCNTYHDRVTMYWGDGDYEIDIPINKKNNVATFRTASGYSKFGIFCEQAQIDYEKECKDPVICQPAEIEDKDHQGEYKYNLTEWASSKDPKSNKIFDLDNKTISSKRLVSTDDRISNEDKLLNTSAELLELHQKFGHISFDRLREMAKQGTINSKYAHCPVPSCSACMFAKARRKKWGDKPRGGYQRNLVSRPGDCVSVDQLVSPTPGLVAQMTGILTTKRYKYVTMFVDHASRLGYIYLQKSADVEETLKAKTAFELFSRSRGVQIKSYQADNEVFRANKWVESCRENKQPLLFTGVNAHHQNGFAERRIGMLQELTRAMMIHAQHKWRDAVTPNLWPYAMRMANDCLNETPNMIDNEGRTAEQIFSQTSVQANTKHQKYSDVQLTSWTKPCNKDKYFTNGRSDHA